MEKTSQFQKNAGVFAVDGQRLGQLERVVLDPETKLITHLVISSGGLLDGRERVVAIEWVAETTPNQITLHIEEDDLDELPKFETPHYVPRSEDTSLPPTPPVAAAGQSNPAYGAPMIGAALDPHSVEPAPDELVVTHIDRNIPRGTVPLKEGAKVITAEGKHAGDLERVLADPDVDQVTHLLMSKGILAKEKKLIPIQWATLIGEEEVQLGVHESAIEDLDAVPE